MANIQLYHFPGSPPCRSVLMTAKALGVPLELKPLSSLNKDHLSPEFLKDIFQGNDTYRGVATAKSNTVESHVDFFVANSNGSDNPDIGSGINPDHTTPTIVDGDFTLWESRAIMRYLVGKFGGEDNSLYSRDLQKRAEVDRLLDYDLGVFYRTMLETLMLPLRNKTKTTKEQDEKVIKAFERIDTQVKDKKFLTGNTLTIADFAVVVGFAAEVLYPGDMSKYPNAMAWYKRMQALPYYKEVNQPFFDLVENLKKQRAETS